MEPIGIKQPGTRAHSKSVTDPRYFIADILPSMPLTLVQFAKQKGVNHAAWFQGLNFSEEQIRDPAFRISYRQARLFIHRALETLRIPNIGLEMGREPDAACFGLLGVAMKTCRTMKEAIQIGVTHQRLCGGLLDVQFESKINQNASALVAKPRFHETKLLPLLCEELFSTLLNLARELMRSPIMLQRLELSYAPPAYAQEYMDFFQCDVRFNARANRMFIDSSILDHPLPGYDPAALRHILDLCSKLDTTQTDGEIVGMVERLLQAELPRIPQLSDVARKLHLSERSLRRKLAECDQSFRKIHDRLRTNQAIELLRTRRLNLTEIGTELGFSDPREFRRAFKRWTGMSPQSARESAEV